MNGNKTPRIVFFYTRVNGHVMGVLKALCRASSNLEIDFIHWENDRQAGVLYEIPAELGTRIKFHKRSTFTEESLYELLKQRSPDIVYSGWNDRGYMHALRSYRSSGGMTNVVCGIDDQWMGSVRQHVGSYYFRFFYKRIFDYMWVAGKPQYHYAQRFGYTHENILTNLLSADTSVFNRRASFSRRFVFVGRYTPEKGADLLIDSYLALPMEIRRSWPLVMVGDGVMKDSLMEKSKGQVEFLPFLQPDDLMKELLKGGVACVPSYREQWGVVIHEYAVLGLPIIASSACGAVSEFLISGYNGYLYRNKDADSLSKAMLRMTGMTDGELRAFSDNSAVLGVRINPDLSAHSLLSALQLSGL